MPHPLRLALLLYLPLMGLPPAGVTTNWFRDFSSRTHEQTGFVFENGLQVARADRPTASTWLLDFESPLPPGATGLLCLEDNAPYGKAAWFRTAANTLTIPTPSWGPFMGRADTPDFTLSLRFRVDATALDSRFLSRETVCYLPKERQALRQALRVSVRQGRLAVDLENLFRVAGVQSSRTLTAPNPLEGGRWYLMALRHHRTESRIDLDLEGETVATTSTLSDSGDRSAFGFFGGIEGPMILGAALVGALDEVRLDKGQKRPVHPVPWPDQVASWTSMPIPLRPFSRVLRLDIAPATARSLVQMEMRLSPEYFLADDPMLVWKAVPLGQNETMPDLGTGRYAQVRLRLRSQQTREPGRVEGIALVTDSESAPESPLLLDVKALPGGAELSWQVTTDERVAVWRIWWAPVGEPFNRKSAQNIAVGRNALKLGAEATEARAVWRIGGLEDGRRYTVAITAQDRRGAAMESDFSRKAEVTPDPFAR